MKCGGRHACVGCVQCCHTHIVDAVKTETHSAAVRLVRRRMTGTIRNILVSDDSELIGRNFLIVDPVNVGHADINVVHITADNVNVVRGMAVNADLDIYELIATEE